MRQLSLLGPQDGVDSAGGEKDCSKKVTKLLQFVDFCDLEKCICFFFKNEQMFCVSIFIDVNYSVSCHFLK